jgi:opacity protein-like surface antigen
MPYRQPWERYFGVALDFQWNQFNQSIGDFSGTLDGNQFALAFLARAQYPLMGDASFTRGRWVPFIMAGPAVVWTTSDFQDFGGNKTSTNVGVVVELGLEYFIIPQLSIGPSFRYRHVFGPNHDFQNVKIDSQLDQFMILGRVAYHF